ncbi:MAG: D-alanyl-D-alanine carboxypeptidase [Alphaproteobacteria bacterium]|nr:D-alanyl-D-alanine carboxypeptidase [Alphaproteobacteria bacterium]
MVDHSPLLRASKFLLVLLGFSLVFYPIQADAKVRHTKHRIHQSSQRRAAPVSRGAEYADLVVEAETGMVLHATDPEGIRHPASLTKMMTLYLTFQALDSGKLKLDHRLWISSNAARQSPSKLGLRPGQSIRVEDAILGLVTKSANDAAVVLAEGIGGTTDHFAQMMTRQARALGMNSTVFRNPSGLPNPKQVTSAADMLRLGYALAYHYPHYYPYLSRESFYYAGAQHRNHNHLMERYEGMDGIKTGYIQASGFNLVASAVKNGTRIIGVVMGGRSAAARDNQMEQLLDEGFAALPYGSKRARLQMASASKTNANFNFNAGDFMPMPAEAPAIFAPSNRTQPQQQQTRTASAEPRTEIPQSEQGSTTDTGQPPPDAPPQPPTNEQQDTKTSAPLAEQMVAPPRIKEKKKPARASKAKTKPAPGKEWGIQIGAYTDPATGQQALSNAAKSFPKLLRKAEPALQKVFVNDEPTHRARFLKLDEKTARSACKQLIKQKQNCLVVMPQK